ncbi:MAG TPA: immunoglobulin domain-containing protein, partial [Candidatus Sulfotelmatobacter sp.]|nr:immunoglobulin domain-containing protein [Candidatus Sulfotelmatobacter sp.]
DRNSGVGIVMADRTLASVPAAAPSAPALTMVPYSKTATLGERVNFYAAATGSAPLSCQWQKNGSPISGATNWAFTIAAVDFSDEGAYSVRVTNRLGTAVSTNAVLRVPSLENALDAPELTWVTGGAGQWVGQPTTTHDGSDAAQSPLIERINSTWLQTTVVGPGTLTFWWSANCENGVDYFKFSTNGIQADRIDGNPGWAQKTYAIPAGDMTLTWTYQRNGTLHAWANEGWVDQVSYVPYRPTINTQPLSQTLRIGWSTTLKVVATGNGALSYQWRKDNNDIAGANAPTYALLNARTNDSGNYSVVVTSIYGTATSSNAQLTVLPPLGLPEALDGANLVWSTGGSSNWVAQTNITFDGQGAAQSGAISNRQNSWLATTVMGPGTLSFKWKVSSEGNSDFLTFAINGVAKGAIAGEIDWQLQTFVLAAGAQTLQWTYAKDPSFARGADAAWLDNVSFVPPNGPPVITSQPTNQTMQSGMTATLAAGATGALPMSYQWRKGGTPINGATGAAYSIAAVQSADAGNYSVMVTNSQGWALSSNATLTVVAVPVDHF